MFITNPTTKTKKITNFLKAMKAARGMTVTQKEERTLIEHITKE
jgi:hypothetical protein